MSTYIRKVSLYKREISFISVELSVSEIVSRVNDILLFYLDTHRSASLDNLMPITSEMQKVLRYLSNGYSVKQISCILNKNIKTISTHKRTTMIRLGVKTTMELIVKYRVINILECIMRDCHEIENFDELDKNRSINTLFTC